ncbi:MSC_0882 family membrane protein [Spiroplasma endosymbiont of Diplazon laetatorius]|uniref:MSC_0882 family membrane protein n=1 Tax=Spiroplasma endosymbiont of Diplazon laetatorius TaxID=3066322 RepID=UPI0030CDADD2
MSGFLNPFKKENSTENQNQQNVGNFAFNQNPQQNMNYHNETAMYQKNLIENKNEGYIRPRNRTFDNSYFEQAQQTPQFGKNEITGEIFMKGYVSNNTPNNNSMYYQPQINQQPVQRPQVQQMNQPQMRQNSYNNYPIQNENLKQEYLDFDNNARIDYGNYRDENQYNRMVYPPNNQMNNIQVNENYNNKPLYENYSAPNNNMQYGYNDFSNNNQFYNQNSPYGYNPEIDYAPVSSNNYNPYENKSYKDRYKNANMMPKEIGKEVRSEKLRIFLMFLIGATGIITSSLMLAIYYKAGEKGTYMGIGRQEVMYPFFSILLLIVSAGFFFVSISDFGFLYSNVKKYERDLYFGRESVPYFITRNYRNLISRSVYLNWISFNIYVFGAIVLGIMYGLQSQYLTNNTNIYFLFWKIGELKSLESEIKINIIILFTTLIIHVLNLVTTRTRKNNIIGYYGYEIIPQQEIKEIRKKANKVCMIIFFTVLAIILFLIVIPWLIVRKKRGLPLKPWGSTV